jgi:hypothetical protein
MRPSKEETDAEAAALALPICGATKQKPNRVGDHEAFLRLILVSSCVQAKLVK